MNSQFGVVKIEHVKDRKEAKDKLKGSRKSANEKLGFKCHPCEKITSDKTLTLNLVSVLKQSCLAWSVKSVRMNFKHKLNYKSQKRNKWRINTRYLNTN